MAGKSSQKYSQKQAVKQRIAAQRAQQAREERRRRVLVGVGGTVAVVAVIVALVVVSLTTGGGSTRTAADPSAGPQPAAKSLVSDITGISASTFEKMPVQLAQNPPIKVTADVDPLAKDGKPEMLYIGGEFCPYCAGERWAMVAALSRFGEFNGLKTVFSSSDEGSISTLPTLSFRGATYTSDYVAFTPVEVADRLGNPLETPSDAQAALQKKLNATGYPFISIGNKWQQQGTSVDPSLLVGLKPADVAKQAGDPSTPIGKAVLTSANMLTAGICDITSGQPANVCSSDTIKGVQQKLVENSAKK